MTKIIATSRSFEKMPKTVYAAYTTEYLVMYWSCKKWTADAGCEKSNDNLYGLLSVSS